MTGLRQAVRARTHGDLGFQPGHRDIPVAKKRGAYLTPRKFLPLAGMPADFVSFHRWGAPRQVGTGTSPACSGPLVVFHVAASGLPRKVLQF